MHQIGNTSLVHEIQMFYVESSSSPGQHSRGAHCQERWGAGVGHPGATPRGHPQACESSLLTGWWILFPSQAGAPSAATDCEFPSPDVSKGGREGTTHPLIW